MTTNLQKQLIPFEIFMEKMEKVVEEVKKSHLSDGVTTFELKDFDFRGYDFENNSVIFPIPSTLDDYYEMYKFVQENYKLYLENVFSLTIPNEMYFDLFWNSVETNSAFYDHLALYIYFDYEFGIYYDDSDDIKKKIEKRNSVE